MCNSPIETKSKIAGVDSRDRLQCLIVWPRDVVNLPVDENAGYCETLVLFLQNALELSTIWHFIKLLYLNRYCILLQHPQSLHAGPCHTQRKLKKFTLFSDCTGSLLRRQPRAYTRRLCQETTNRSDIVVYI